MKWVLLYCTLLHYQKYSTFFLIWSSLSQSSISEFKHIAGRNGYHPVLGTLKDLVLALAFQVHHALDHHQLSKGLLPKHIQITKDTVSALLSFTTVGSLLSKRNSVVCWLYMCGTLPPHALS